MQASALPPIYTTWTADTLPAGELPYPPSVLPPYLAPDGVWWALTGEGVLLRDGQPIAAVQPPGGTQVQCSAVWVDAAGVVVASLIVELPDGRRFVAQGRWRPGKVGEKTQERA